MCCTRLAANTGRKKSPSAHHRTTLSGCVFATKVRIDNRKKVSSSSISPTCLCDMVNFGPLVAEICWRVWGTPTKFNGFHILAALLHSTLVMGIIQTLRRWTEGATYIRQGGHHVGPHFYFFVTFHFELDYSFFSFFMGQLVLVGLGFSIRVKGDMQRFFTKLMKK